jgi:hypothetical protein
MVKEACSNVHAFSSWLSGERVVKRGRSLDCDCKEQGRYVEVLKSELSQIARKLP